MDLKAMLLKLLAAMGQEVPADATDEAIGQACDKCMTGIAENKLGAEADAYMKENEGKIANKETFRAAFILNPAAAKQIVGAMKAPEAPGVTLNKDGKAQTPPPPAAQVDNKAAERHALIAEISVKHGLSGALAVEKAKQTKPELFQ